MGKKKKTSFSVEKNSFSFLFLPVTGKRERIVSPDDVFRAVDSVRHFYAQRTFCRRTLDRQLEFKLIQSTGKGEGRAFPLLV